MKMSKMLIAALVLATAFVTGCKPQPEEQYKGAKPGDNCKELYKEMVNQNLCNQALADG